MILPKLEDNSAQSGACSDCSECAYEAFKNVEEPDWLCVGYTYHGPSMSVTLITPSQALGWGREQRTQQPTAIREVSMELSRCNQRIRTRLKQPFTEDMAPEWSSQGTKQCGSLKSSGGSQQNGLPWPKG